MDLLIRFPWIAFVAALLFFVLWRLHPKRSSMVAALAWLIYGIYEFTIFFRLTCDDTCIRVDLLVLYPLLLLISLWAFIAALCFRKS
ncbi:hypothetical protein RHD99_01045 [Buttiauxella selenatireducens]|uniref:Uncharacterized protein n=1 Tax=Buttiauxella selenatireducens TaxID=3073902 RepID=A0ABY9SCC3_9ENTR|nr:hypothetical protein [Buttiauxella sp. R73]WMY74603.1 hypothetical protein RHD99_01045 [Buttiauxella sp. R73]